MLSKFVLYALNRNINSVSAQIISIKYTEFTQQFSIKLQDIRIEVKPQIETVELPIWHHSCLAHKY